MKLQLGTSNSLPVEREIRQGHTLSGKLFITVLEYAMKRLNWDDKGKELMVQT